MFWSLGHFTSPSIDTILDREGGFTLEELLEEDELLQECKGQNTKLNEFLVQQDTLVKLVSYVTEMPGADDSESRKYKYPFVSSEVLSCDIPAVRDALFASPPLIAQLLSLLRQPPPLPPVLAGYVVKVITSLQKQGSETFEAFFAAPDGIKVDVLLPLLMTHIGSDSILQLLINLCVGEPPAAEPGGPAAIASSREELAASSWLPHSALIPAALDALGDVESEEGLEGAANASSFLCALLAASTDPPHCLEEGEGGHERCAQLVGVCLGDDVSGPPNLPALEVVLQLLGKLREGGSSSPCLGSILDAIEVDIERFFAALAAPTPLPNRIARFLPAASLAYRPRGQQRCKLLLLMEECLKSERANLIHPLVELGLFHIVIDLLLLPHTCNALHMRASAILEWAVSTSCELASTVHASLITDAMLAQRLLGLVAEYAPAANGGGAAGGAGGGGAGGANGLSSGIAAVSISDDGNGASTPPPPPPPPPAPKPRKILPCCHAFVMHIGACLLSAAQREPEVRELLERVDGWEAFINPGGALTAWEALQSKPLGGLAPTRHSDNESDDDDEIDATTMERVLAAQAAASRGQDDHIQDDDEDDEEGGHSSEYLQHFAQYLSNRNFLNQTSDNVHDFAAMGEQLQGNSSSDSWTAEFDEFDVEPSAAGPAAAAGEGGGEGPAAAATGGMVDAFDAFDDEGTDGASSGSGGAGGSGGNTTSDLWAADFESLSSSSAPADGNMDEGWAAFDAPSPPTGIAIGGGESGGSAPSAEEPPAAASSPSAATDE